jgi:hypothetical protein
MERQCSASSFGRCYCCQPVASLRLQIKEAAGQLQISALVLLVRVLHCCFLLQQQQLAKSHLVQQEEAGQTVVVAAVLGAGSFTGVC